MNKGAADLCLAAPFNYSKRKRDTCSFSFNAKSFNSALADEISSVEASCS